MRQYTHVGRLYNVGHGWVLVNLAYFGDLNLMLRDTIHAMGSSSNIHARGSSYNIHARGSSSNIHARGSSSNIHAMGSSCLTRTFESKVLPPIDSARPELYYPAKQHRSDPTRCPLLLLFRCAMCN